MVIEAVLRIVKRALKNRAMIWIAVAAFVGIYVLRIQFPFIILAAGIAGWIGSNAAPQLFASSTHGSKGAEPDVGYVVDLMFDRGELAHADPSWAHALRVLAIWLPIWLGPVFLVWFLTGSSSVWTQLGFFFSMTLPPHAPHNS